jgi:uncharacterized protein (DUF433 family)
VSDHEKMKAIFETLKQSIRSGLNASLTPEDCRELIRMFTLVNMRNTIQSTPTVVLGRPPVPRGSTPVEKIVSGVAELAHGVIDDIKDDFYTGAGRPARRRRKR